MCAKRVTRERNAPRPPKSREQALNSLMALCARAEKSTGDARRLMSGWGVKLEEQEQGLEQLIKERFIDDERFATLYIREKSRLSGWGGYKIRGELSRKGISKEIIEEQMSQLDREEMRERLRQMIERRLRTVKYSSKYQLRDKLMRYGASLGYDFEMVREVISEAISKVEIASEEDEADEFFD